MSQEEFDYQQEAQVAMRMAVAAHGLDQLQWVRLALVWRDLGRDKEVAGAFGLTGTGPP